MEHRIEVTDAKQHIQCGFVGDVELGPLDAGPGEDQVCHHHFMAGGQQVLDHVRANVACTTDNQNFIQTSWKLLFTDAVNLLKRAGGMISYR
jgi:hypothetical protein